MAKKVKKERKLIVKDNVVDITQIDVPVDAELIDQADFNIERPKRVGVKGTIASPFIDDFMDQVLNKEELTRNDIDWIISDVYQTTLEKFCEESGLNAKHWRAVMQRMKPLNKESQDEFRNVFKTFRKATVLNFKKP